MALATHTFEISGSDARELRLLLQGRHLHGVTFTEQRHWLLYRRFTVTAPPGVLESIKGQVEELKTELWGDRQF